MLGLALLLHTICQANSFIPAAGSATRASGLPDREDLCDHGQSRVAGPR